MGGDGDTKTISPFLATMGKAAPWIAGGLAVVNYFSARKAQREMRNRLRPIAQDQMQQVVDERGEIVSEYGQKAKMARQTGDLAMARLYDAREAKYQQSQAAVGQTSLRFGSGNIQASNLLDAYNMQGAMQQAQTTSTVTGLQNQLASELRGLDASALELKSMYAKQGVGLDYSATNIDALKYV
tara:strand:+ start:1745 stop:2296 length:552 start_codon:yes stop_codon:yes gene_type:complete